MRVRGRREGEGKGREYGGRGGKGGRERVGRDGKRKGKEE